MYNKEDLKKEILDLGSDSLQVFGGLFEGGYNIQQVPDEISELLYYIMNNKNKLENFIEIGAAAGGNTKLFNKYFNFKNVIIVDNNMHSKHTLRNENLKDITYLEYIGDSQTKEANEWIKQLNLKFDVMIIDADHSYEGVKTDFNNYKEFLNKDGYLIFHDTIACIGVKQFFSELKNIAITEGLTLIAEYGADVLPRCGLGLFKKI